MANKGKFWPDDLHEFPLKSAWAKERLYANFDNWIVEVCGQKVSNLERNLRLNHLFYEMLSTNQFLARNIKN